MLDKSYVDNVLVEGMQFLKICFPQHQRGGENYDFLYQNSI